MSRRLKSNVCHEWIVGIVHIGGSLRRAEAFANIFIQLQLMQESSHSTAPAKDET